jgi:hypothetical protein
MNSDTPETDNEERMAYSQEYMVPTEFARRIERERDEARAALEYIAHAGLPARQLEDCARKALEEMK